MVKEPTAARVPNKKTLEALCEGLEEIGAHFELTGFSSRKVQPGEDALSPERDESDVNLAEEENGDDDYGDESYSVDEFDREDIEIAIDEFISVLLKASIIKKGKSGKLPGFTDVFKKFFGEDHELTTKAQTFEEYIKGYFGWVSLDEMRLAHDEFLEIQGIVEIARKGVQDGK